MFTGLTYENQWEFHAKIIPHFITLLFDFIFRN